MKPFEIAVTVQIFKPDTQEVKKRVKGSIRDAIQEAIHDINCSMDDGYEVRFIGWRGLNAEKKPEETGKENYIQGIPYRRTVRDKSGIIFKNESEAEEEEMKFDFGKLGEEVGSMFKESMKAIAVHSVVKLVEGMVEEVEEVNPQASSEEKHQKALSAVLAHSEGEADPDDIDMLKRTINNVVMAKNITGKFKRYKTQGKVYKYQGGEE